MLRNIFYIFIFYGFVAFLIFCSSIYERTRRRCRLKIPEFPQDLIELERKLQKMDEANLFFLDKENFLLKNYSPNVFLESFEKLNYQKKLPKLYRSNNRTESQNEINIEDLNSLLAMKDAPAYKVLWGFKDKPEPKIQRSDTYKLKPILPPVEWTRWKLPKYNLDIHIPLYKGILSYLNYFIKEAYREDLIEIDRMKARAKAVENAVLKRNLEVEQAYAIAFENYKKAKKYQAHQWSQRKKEYNDQVRIFLSHYKQEKEEIDNLVRLLSEKTSNGLLARAEKSLRFETFPSFVPLEFSLKFDEELKILILEHQYPDIGSIVWTKNVVLKSGLTKKLATQKEAKEAAKFLYPSLSLRLACELARLDQGDQIEVIVVNGWADYIHKSTGHMKRAYCASLFARKSQLLELNLSLVDPLAAFSALKGVAARNLELTPIAPIMRLNKDDRRFVEAKEILAHMDEGQNLAVMEWEEFEHLCRELLEKAFAGSGSEVKVTQASRDQGVDAVIFDPDVLRGGKIIVQAKRYTNTVDVSAVRDLYGTIMHEGATKGILVTTSHYGPDAYEFAKDKQITLLNGQELLGLLQKYGYNFRIDLVEARKINSERKDNMYSQIQNSIPPELL